MDIRLFKFLILVVSEGAFFLFLHFAPASLQNMKFYAILYTTLILLMVSLPLLVLLPEDNWIWLIEENPRGRKISLRSKASKHLHLSMLYFFVFGFFPFIVSIAAISVLPKYQFPLLKELIGIAVVYGIYCAWKNYRNVMKFDSLFAVGWDRRAAFFEIFVGFKVSKKAYYFYSGLGLLCGFIIMGLALLAPILYYKYIEAPFVPYDMERYVVLTTLLNFFIITGSWTTTMYVFFQIAFGRRLQKWVKTPRHIDNINPGGKIDGPD